MNLTLQRVWYQTDGIVSNAFDEAHAHVLTTLEHAFASGSAAQPWIAKVNPGVYACVRGMHQLHHGPAFETFEVAGVIGHSGILFHHGNWNEDSEGCILTGDALATAIHNGRAQDLVTNTDAAFQRFMALQKGVDRFQLTVKA